VKLREPGLSLVCYHCCRGWGRRPVSFFTRRQRIVLQQMVEMDSIPKRKENGVPHFTEDNLQRIIINPFYAVTVAPQLTVEHEPPMGEAEWVQANASLIREMGSERWLRQLLDVLEGKVGAPDEPVNPSKAISIDPMFAAVHPPLIGRDMWVDVNVKHIRNMGAEGWLRQLLDVLDGDIVTAEEVGLAPPGGTFGYGAPGRSHLQRRGKKKPKKRRHT
jgi:hypothetical protein